MQTADLAPGYRISRVIRGNWQLAGGHGAVDREAAVADLFAFADAGITTFDCADIYTGVEEIIGLFRERTLAERGAQAADAIRVHTKFVPDLDALGTITRVDVEAAIDTSLKRLRTERLDLVQFHWWDYAVPRYVEVAGWLDELRRAGKIAHVGGTNFDTPRAAELRAAGLPLFSMQVQYSLLDRRPERKLLAEAASSGMAILCYGTVAGGFLSDKWLGVPEPREPLENRSLTKYKLIIDEVGGWELFQALLSALRGIADRRGTDIATVASRAVLERPGVSAVIVGARNRAHLPANLAISDMLFTAEDAAAIDAVLADANPVPGDVYELERDRTGRHGSIMKYGLNKTAA
ncbi:aldo/keto reductase [Antarcticirhabdus aurantiaca]|uniref:Aldo/keto reductase n=1 Tax=Antarcticirhabdus aurantiaca TaxID=2606717 RepID=A0ACD4NN09_9HYPH|nr:aldo/keto reductase [Antarcticirhabdus aurantiaca]WAJ28127.1 aldo/keto reductase [Jeongeuplla avenae]